MFFTCTIERAKKQYPKSPYSLCDWLKSATGTPLPVSYSIYRDAGLTDLVATIPASQPLQFSDHNRTPGVTYTYYLVGTNAAGTISLPIAITVTQDC